MNTRATPTPSTTPAHHVGLPGCAMLGGSKLSGWTEHVPAVCFPFFLPSIYTFSTYSTELLEIQRFLNVGVDGGFNCPASSRRCPGRMDPAYCPRHPITSPAPESPISTFGTCMGRHHHRTDDPLVEGLRPGTSALGRCQRARKAPGASVQPGAGHSGDTARRVAQRQHSYRTIHPGPSGSRTRRYGTGGGGIQKESKPVTGPPPLRPLRAAVSTDQLFSDH